MFYEKITSKTNKISDTRLIKEIYIPPTMKSISADLSGQNG